MKPTEILSLGFTSADKMPEGRIKGALATAVVARKRRRERWGVCMPISIATAISEGSVFCDESL
jgi:hypothetical protein